MHVFTCLAGAAFGNAYGCARLRVFAALVTISVEFGGPCNQPMPYLAFHGTADPIVPYAGTAQNMQGWASASDCGPAKTVQLGPQANLQQLGIDMGQTTTELR